MDKQIHLAIILGSTREGRLCESVGAWVMQELEKRSSLVVTLVDPAALDLPLRHQKESNAGLVELSRQLDSADAFLVITPEYNHSFPAALKFVIDSAYNEWQAKPVGFVSYGGMSGGIRAVEQLRQVFSELHAVTVRDTLSFINVWQQFNEEGKLVNPERAVAALDRVMAQLDWWARAARDARDKGPYAKAV